MLSVNDINLLQAQNEGLKKQNKELQQEVAELKAYKDVNEDFKIAWEELKAENERLKEKILKFRWDNPYFDLYNNVVNQRDMWEQKSKRYKQTLQKIKEIAEAPKPFIDFSETKTATEVGYDYAVICNELELRLHKVLMLITKAEEE